jgi:S-adenosylhomocysteine hydrolase
MSMQDERFRAIFAKGHRFRHLYENKLIRDHVTYRRRSELAEELVQTRARPAGMPLLDFTATLLPAALDLSNAFLIASIQILDDAALLLSVLQRFGLDPAHVALLGKPYSTSMAVVADLTQRGTFVHPHSYEMSEGVPLHQSREPSARDVLRRARAWCDEDPDRRLYLLDSGGGLVHAIHAPEFEGLRARCAAVEVTSQGVFHIDGVRLDVPVVNVARSWAKITYESVDIGLAVAEEIDRHVANMNFAIERAVVLGYGTIGRPVADCLARRGMRVSVIDPAPSPPHSDGRHEYARDRAEAIASAQMILGCSGRASLTQDDWGALADHTILASASSYDVEFCGWQLRAAYRPHELPIFADALGFETLDNAPHASMFLGSRSDPSHFTYPIRFEDGRRVYLLNGGCPVNFTGRPIAMPLDASALTMSLELCGIAQAAEMLDTRGITPLRRDWQERVVERQLADRRSGYEGPPQRYGAGRTM